MSSLYTIQSTSYGGRGAFATSEITEGTVVHTSPYPFAHVVCRVFRKEVCAWCWRYTWDDAGKGSWPVKLTGEGGAGKGKGKERDRARGGLWFCCESCKEEWLKDDLDGFAIEVYETIDREAAKAYKIKPALGSGKKTRNVLDLADIVSPDVRGDDVTQELVDDVWTKAEATARMSFGKRKALAVPLEYEHDADLARFVASGLISVYRQETALSAPLSASSATTFPRSPTPSPSRSPSSLIRAESPSHRPISWNEFLSLQPNEIACVRSSPHQLSQWMRVYLFLASIFAAHPLRDLAADPTYARALFARDAGNSFGIWQLPHADESEMFGWGVWVDASYFNHSCAPNLVKRRTGRTFSFITTRPVTVGEELCISYGSVSDDIKARRRRLWEGWWFWCGCTRCAQDMRESERGGDPDEVNSTEK